MSGYTIVKRIPNFLTLLRFLAVPFFVIIMVNPTPESSLWATGIFILAALTDWLDGYIARMYNAESILGTVLDPLADKILVMAALVMLCAASAPPKVPAWMVVVILTREMIVNGLRALAAIQGTVVAASRLAKHKTAWMMLAIVFLLVRESHTIFGTVVNFHETGMIFLWLALAISVISGVQYAVALRKMFI